MAVVLVPHPLFQGVILSSETLLGLTGSDENHALPCEPQSPVASRSLLSPVPSPPLVWPPDLGTSSSTHRMQPPPCLLCSGDPQWCPPLKPGSGRAKIRTQATLGSGGWRHGTSAVGLTTAPCLESLRTCGITWPPFSRLAPPPCRPAASGPALLPHRLLWSPDAVAWGRCN